MGENRAIGVDGEDRASWMFLLDWGVVSLTLVSAGTSALAAFIAFRVDDTSAMAEAGLACASAVAAAWLGRKAARAADRWHRAEDVARLSEQKFRSAFAEARLGILFADATGRVIESNRAVEQTLGYTAAELSSMSIGNLNRPADRGRFASSLRGLVAGDVDSYADDRWYVRKDGTEVPMAIRASAIRDAQGRFQFVIGVLEDVTEANRIRARLVAAERLAAVGSVAAGLAHEINNPLCSVQGNLSFALEALGDDHPDMPEVRQALGEAQEAARRVRDLVRDLRAFSGGFGDGEGRTDLCEVMADAIATSRDFVERRARVVVDLPALPPVPGPVSRLSRIFATILRRAAGAMPEGAPGEREIRISGRLDGPLRLSIEISDDGPAIPQAEALHLFEPFYAPRVGAGLAAVLGMVRAVGGDVIAESLPGRNVIRVLLPISSDAASAA